MSQRYRVENGRERERTVKESARGSREWKERE